MSSHFLLIDGVLRPKTLSWLYSSGDAVEIEPLYIGTRWEELKELGPLLARVESNTPPLQAFQHDPLLQQQASWMRSDSPLHVVASHLRQFVTTTDSLGSHSLFRFADPLVASHWLDSYPASVHAWLLGPITAWRIAWHPPVWEPSTPVQWKLFEPGQNSLTPDGKINHLAEPQIAALEQAYRWRFKERLYQWLSDEYPQTLTQLTEQERGQWLEQRLQDADAWGVVSERSIAIWFERCACWGHDFATRADSPYQSWLAQTPAAHSMPPELRIQALDNDCLMS